MAAADEREDASLSLPGEAPERQIALLSSIIRIFRETIPCRTEEEVAKTCLKVAEELTGSAYGFIGELNSEGQFDTTPVSEAGWLACRVPLPEARRLLHNMPNRGVNRLGLKDQRSWIINDVEHAPEKVPRPDGHPPLTSFMGVPFLYSGGVTGMIALAGKHQGYDERDREEVEALSVAVVEALNRRRAERQVEHLNEELTKRLSQVEAANKELEDFSYSVSHDLRAPVRHISGYLELLDQEALSCLDDKSRHYLEVIGAAARKMGTLIDGLLAFSRLGRAELQKNRVEMDQLVGEVVQEQAALAPGREVEWVIASLPVVVADRVMLHRVVWNLVENALKFSRHKDKARVEIGVRELPGEFAFFVRDNGAGFDMKYKDKLFGLFQRLHGQEEFEGIGVGLAHVQRIALRHGGRVWAEGEVDRGATFWFTLPRAEEE